MATDRIAPGSVRRFAVERATRCIRPNCAVRPTTAGDIAPAPSSTSTVSMTTRSASALVVSIVRTSASRPVVLARMRHSRHATSSGAPMAMTTMAPPITSHDPAGRAVERGESERVGAERHEAGDERQPEGHPHPAPGQIGERADGTLRQTRRHRPCAECVTAHWADDRTRHRDRVGCGRARRISRGRCRRICCRWRSGTGAGRSCCNRRERWRSSPR